MTVAIPLLIGALTVVGTWLVSLRSGRCSPASPGALRSIIIPAYTSHARHLPKPSRHAFSYPLLYLGVDVDELEKGRLDLPGRLLGYGGSPWTKILGLRSYGYLRPGPESLRAKAERLLREQGVREEDMARIWLVTMPSFAGFEGINPLSVWYIYSEKRELSCVILEVHNTFGEKHAYVLKRESQHLEETAEGYDHSWVFPRSFHVSPFNSRNGYYRLDIIDPFGPSTSSSDIPQIKVFLRLLTPSKQTKLQALLASSPTRPSVDLDPSHSFDILRILLRYPLSLLLTTPRIMYQAYRLHYEKQLAVYPRPEPSSEAAKEAWNAPQSDEEGLGVPIGWQAPGWSERTARRLVESWSCSRSGDVGIDLEIEFLDERTSLQSHGNSSKNSSMCTVKSADPKFFTNLLMAPSPTHFARLAPELLTTIDHPDLFVRFFEPSSPSSQHTYLDQRIWRIRQRFYLFFLARSTIAPTPDLWLYDQNHFSGDFSLLDRCRVFLIIYLAFTADVAEEKIMRMMGATFVEGREPWKLWERALSRAYVQDPTIDTEGWTVVEKEDLGSIRLGA